MESKHIPKLMLTKLNRTYDGMIAEFGLSVIEFAEPFNEEKIDI